MDVDFRAIVEDDFQSICDLLPSAEELFLVYAQGKFPLTIPQVKKLVDNRMEPTVMLHRGRVVGFANFYNHREAKSAFIGNIVIDRSLRGQGLGRQLVCHMIDRAFREHDLPSVKLHVYNRNLPALLLYASLGFRPYAMQVKQDYKGDPVLLFILRLDRAEYPGR